jgi:hypothetical protein
MLHSTTTSRGHVLAVKPGHWRDAQGKYMLLESFEISLIILIRYGVTVPGVRFIDLTEGVLGMEWIEGHSVRALLGGEPEQDETEDVDGPSPSPSILPPNISAYGVTDGMGRFSFMVAHAADWAS